MSSMGFTENCSESEITNLHLPLIAIDKYVITLEISMNHRWVKAMEIKKTSQDLPTPMLHRSKVNPLVLLPIPNNKNIQI